MDNRRRWAFCAYRDAVCHTRRVWNCCGWRVFFRSSRSRTILLPDEHKGRRIVHHSTVALTSSGAPMLAVLSDPLVCFSFGGVSFPPLLLQLHTSTETSTRPQWLVAENGPTDQACSVPHHRSCAPRPAVPTVPYTDAAWAAALNNMEPVLFTATPLGECVATWASPQHLRTAEGRKKVSVHVATKQHMDFVHKNFTLKHVTFGDLVKHCFQHASSVEEGTDTPCSASAPEVWYFRSVGQNMKTKRSNFFTDFPHLSNDFILPPSVGDRVLHAAHHQSCLRINQAGMQLWTHYDVMDNILCHVVGRKRVILFPISQHNNLYVRGSSSPVMNMDAPDLERFPRVALALRVAREVILHPGDMLFIPALWLHHVTALDACISVNIFFKREPLMCGAPSLHKVESGEGAPQEWYEPKDLYGNKDLPMCVAWRQHMLESAREAVGPADVFTASAGVKRRDKLTPCGALPREFRVLMLQQLARDIEELCDEQ